MKFRIFVYAIAIITGILIMQYGVGVNKDMETLFSAIIIGLGTVNLFHEVIRLIKRENIKRHKK